MKYVVTVNGRSHEIIVDGEEVEIAGRRYRAELRTVPGTPLRHLVFAGGSSVLVLEPGGAGEWLVQDRGERFEVEALDERTKHIRGLIGQGKSAAHGGTIKAPMPGLVVRVLVEAGHAVSAGDPVVVLEAMKMENELKAPVAGTVERVEVKVGQAVEKGAVVVVVSST